MNATVETVSLNATVETVTVSATVVTEGIVEIVENVSVVHKEMEIVSVTVEIAVTVDAKRIATLRIATSRIATPRIATPRIVSPNEIGSEGTATDRSREKVVANAIVKGVKRTGDGKGSVIWSRSPVKSGRKLSRFCSWKLKTMCTQACTIYTLIRMSSVCAFLQNMVIYFDLDMSTDEGVFVGQTKEMYVMTTELAVREQRKAFRL
jgi:hypothetical protein